MRPVICAFFLFLSSPVFAEPPKVVTDIAPVHSLVSAVMAGVGEPVVLLPPGASPHDYAFRPSAAGHVQDADIVFWIGAELTPWLEQPLDSLTNNPTVALMSVDGVTTREADEHGHDHGHEHSLDPHLWLDPQNAVAWVDRIATDLARIDPNNASVYASNAKVETEHLTALQSEIRQNLSGLEPKFIVLHDAFGYFESRFDVAHIGAVSDVSDAALTPARLQAVQDQVTGKNVKCVISEPGFDPDIISVLFGDEQVPVTVLDPLGSAHEAGPSQYRELIGEIAAVLSGCTD